MRNLLLKLLNASACAGVTIAGLTAAAGQAAAQSPQPLFMQLGDAAPAPVGYLNFCARRPEQCGLKDEVDAQGQPISAEARGQELTAKYYWGVAFSSIQEQAMAHAPMSGAPPAPVAPEPRYNWGAIFGPIHATPAAEAPIAAPQTQAVVVAVAAMPVAPAPVAVSYSPDEPAYKAEPAVTAASVTPMDGGPDEPAYKAEPAVLVAASTTPAVVAADANAPAAPAPTMIANAAAPQTSLAETPAPAAATSDQVAVQPLESNPALMAELDHVNLRINDAIRYVSDRTLYGDEDYWHLPLDPDGRAAGDCKDYVLEKRRALISDGIPAANLSIAIVQTTWGEAHAVLLVTTDRGELVLDSLSAWIKPWQNVHYHWVERQAPGQQLNWVKLS